MSFYFLGCNLNVSTFWPYFSLKVDSARYGIIAAYVTYRNIGKGEELCINYGASYANILKKSTYHKLSWYYKSWKQFKEDHPEQKEYVKIFEAMAKVKFWN